MNREKRQIRVKYRQESIMVDKSKIQKMRTARKLAIFFASIPTDKAIEVMKYFRVSTMEALTAEIRSLGAIDQEVQEAVFSEISEKISQGVKHSAGGDEVAKAILAGVVGEEEAARMLERAKPKRPKPFSTLTGVGAQDLATILSNEQPATVAIVLSFFPPKKSGEIMSYLDENMRDEIIVRLAKDSEADLDIVERIERMLVEKVSSSINTNEEKKKKKKKKKPPLGSPLKNTLRGGSTPLYEIKREDQKQKKKKAQKSKDRRCKPSEQSTSHTYAQYS
eukprot:TRINITY_DN9860_c0_g1_i1.p1 TRINITY_DN9860_c0_g1~~TRINITY_DN9860_c0_g1_i1.p1  ORF type:complete len:279 (-),score=63.66 TRINITY_DN9860_c0_g1_i1:35-871(-)